jgi:hypothetical protein
MISPRAYIESGAYIGSDARIESDARFLNLSSLIGDRRYRSTAVYQQGAWRIFAGCRHFSLEEGLLHWGSTSYPNPDRGARYCAALRMLAAWQPTA